jgi:hypothetical protein
LDMLVTSFSHSNITVDSGDDLANAEGGLIHYESISNAGALSIDNPSFENLVTSDVRGVVKSLSAELVSAGLFLCVCVCVFNELILLYLTRYYISLMINRLL